ncbi:MAG TPA: homoserine O-acetyltransferase [Pyrinomonadaceae bacterium]|nr:homoserine O-acetyltransferase [Pyrinomonadaceae bacterium]
MGTNVEPTYEADCTVGGNEPFRVSGGELRPLTLRYATYGTLNERRDNAVLVCHALSGSARVADWWPELFGEGKPFDTERHCVIGVNVVGSCYGSTGPRSIDARTGRPYGVDFPLVTIADMVRAQSLLLERLGVRRLRAVVGGSIGGMQALQWAVDFPERVERCVAIGAAPLPALGLALNHLQRQAIMNDPLWRGGRYSEDEPPEAGLALARGIAMCSYKSAGLFDSRFARRPDRAGEDPARSLCERFDVAGYLDHQGRSFTRRFDANSYLILSKAMDTFDLARGYGSEESALRRVRARVLLVGITSDWLFPPDEVRALARRMSAAGVRCRYEELESPHGHDGFLADADLLAPLLCEALNERASGRAAQHAA